MRFVDDNGFTLVVWLSDSDEDPLLESKSELWDISVTCPTGEVIIEPGVGYWVPSVEGSKFYINWGIQLPKKKAGDKRSAKNYKSFIYDNLSDIRCRITLDGKSTSAIGVLTKQDLIRGHYGTMTGEDVDHEDESHEGEGGEPKERPFLFGKLTLKEDDINAIQPDDIEHNFLNQIQVTLEWGVAQRTSRLASPAPPWKSTGSTRKIDIPSDNLNLNMSMAGLGDIIACDNGGESEPFELFDFNATPSRPGTWFNFCHAPRWWLKVEKLPVRSPSILGPRRKKPRRGVNKPSQTVVNTVNGDDSDSDVKPNIGKLGCGPEPNVSELENNRVPLRRTSLDGSRADNNIGPPHKYGPQTNLTSDSDRKIPTPDNNLGASLPDTATSRHLKRAPSQEVIDVDALSDPEVDTQMGDGENTIDREPTTSNYTYTRFFMGKITRRRPRCGSGPNKRAKIEGDELFKLEERSVEVPPERSRPSAPLEGKVEADIKPNTGASCDSDDDIVFIGHYNPHTPT